MATSRPLQPVSEWDARLPRMLAVSLAGHVVVVVAVILLQPLAAPRPLPMVAYTVEITDPNALGGRTPPGAPGKLLNGGATVPAPAGGSPKPPEPQAKPVEPTPEPPKPPAPKLEAKSEPTAIKVPEPKPEPEPKLEPKPSPPRPEPKPVPKPEPPKPVAKEEPKPEAKSPTPAKPEARAEAKPAAPIPSPKSEPTGRPGGQAATDATPHDAYGAAAERWRQRAGGGGLGGQDAGSGPIGAGGDGKGGGQLTGLEFIAYRQQVLNKVHGVWATPVARPGLVAKVSFEIAADGAVSNIRLVQGSGNAAYDASALRAVQSANPLPPPPARYAPDFREFLMEFHPEEMGGQGEG